MNRKKILEKIISRYLFAFALGLLAGFLLGFLLENFNNIFLQLVLSLIAAFIFWAVSIYLPEKNRKNILKNTFKIHFKEFKRNAISLFLSEVQDSSYNLEDIEKLLNFKNFREFFKEEHKEGETNWDAIVNAFEQNEIFRKDLFIEMNILRDEVLFVLNNVKIKDENIFQFLKRLSQAVYRSQGSSIDHEESKVIFQLLWSIFTGWSFVEGYSEEDIFEKMVNEI